MELKQKLKTKGTKLMPGTEGGGGGLRWPCLLYNSMAVKCFRNAPEDILT